MNLHNTTTKSSQLPQHRSAFFRRVPGSPANSRDGSYVSGWSGWGAGEEQVTGRNWVGQQSPVYSQDARRPARKETQCGLPASVTPEARQMQRNRLASQPLLMPFVLNHRRKCSRFVPIHPILFRYGMYGACTSCRGSAQAPL